MLFSLCKSIRTNIFHVLKHSLKIKNNSKVHILRQNHTVFSGIQPTGCPHLGNYFGAIKKWEHLQMSHSCIFCIVDLHSITLPQNPDILRKNIHLMTACLLACGIDPKKSILFLQSQVSQHTELAWILGCFVTMARLAHLPQYKEKSSLLKDVPLGLFVYPVLQCSDILLYRTNHVPVGEDQVQHIQLTQHLAHFFNNKYGETFPIPKALIDERCSRIKGLREPEKKMSKSDPNEKNRIELTYEPDLIIERIKKSVTDFTSAVTYDPEKRPGVSNLILMHSLCSGLSSNEICKQSEHLDTGQYKMVVAEAVVEYLKPIRTKIKEYLSDHIFIEEVLKDGHKKASEIATQTILDVKEKVGLSFKKSSLFELQKLQINQFQK